VVDWPQFYFSLIDTLSVWTLELHTCVVDLTRKLKELELTKVLVQSINTESGLPAIDWTAVLHPLLCSDVCGWCNGHFLYM